MCSVYLEWNLEQNSYSRCIYKLECQKAGESIYLERNNKDGTADVFRR